MRFLSLDLYVGKYADFLSLIERPTSPTLVFTPNPEILVRASRDEEFLGILRQADYLVPDAHGLYVGAMMQEGKSFFSAAYRLVRQKRKLAKKYGELIRGSDLTRDLIERANRGGLAKKLHILVIDSYRIQDARNPFEKRKKDIQGRFESLLRARYREIDVTVFFDREMSADAIAHYIEMHDVHYVFSAIGMKEQEERLVEIFRYLPLSQKVVGLGIGSSLDYLLGLQRRAPLWIRSIGLEWLYRLMLDPLGRWKRIYTAVVEFPRLIARGI